MKFNNSSILVTVLAALFVLLIIGLFIIQPFLVILALNTLFPLLSIPYSFSTYIAMLFLEAPFIVKFIYSKE
jgi:ABC-type uncharacterized transport system YnjBCD permease subunit